MIPSMSENAWLWNQLLTDTDLTGSEQCTYSENTELANEEKECMKRKFNLKMFLLLDLETEN